MERESIMDTSRRVQLMNLETYFDYMENRDLDLDANQLRQVIGIHGYKIPKVRKILLKEMVDSIDLLDLRRSTVLDDAVSGDARLPMKEVIDDLKALHWQECHITSILTLSAYPAAAASPIPKRKRKIPEKIDYIAEDPSMGSSCTVTLPYKFPIINGNLRID